MKTKMLMLALLGTACAAGAETAVPVAPAPTPTPAPAAEAPQTPKATTPDHRMGEGWWKARHEQRLEQAKQGGWEIAFIGDSITQGWEGAGKPVWQEFYGSRKAINLGYSGDRTEHVLWRLLNGETDGYKPKLAIIMIGTNNTGHRKDPPADIAAGVAAILDELKVRWPDTKILLLGIFPRSANATDKPRVNNVEANKLLSALGDGQRVHFLDISDKMLTPEGVLTREVMPDALHPQAAGYRIWAESIEAKVAELLAGK